MAPIPLAFPIPVSFSYQDRTISSGYSRSTGTSMNTGPGTPSIASWQARSTVGASAGTVLTIVAHFVIDLTIES